MGLDLDSEPIAAACHYMDEDFHRYGDPKAWRPSDLLRIGALVLMTGPGHHAERKAVDFLNDMIGEGRRRYRAGFYANPFTAEPVARLSTPGADQ